MPASADSSQKLNHDAIAMARFFSGLLNQDIELRIRFAEYFSFVSSESHPWRTYLDDLKKLRAEKRKEIDELEADWEKVTGTLPRNTGKQNELDRHLLWAYNEVGYVPRDRSATSNPRAPDESRGPGISLASIPPDKRAIAQLILDAFASAGFGQLQQVAALANAIAESNLDPNAQVGDDWGLFLLNRSGGLGAGHTPEELKDPTFNVNLVVGLAKRVSSFGSAKSLDEAVSSFVRFISRPANLESQVISRQRIARSILQV
jgi:hypothetical protein